MSNPIRVSVVASTDSDFEVVRRSVELLTDQTVCDQIEMIIVGPNAKKIQVDEDVVSKFGDYQIVEINDFEVTGASMVAGYKKAKGEFLVFIEEHGFPPVDFTEKLISTFEETGADIVGYGLTPSNPGYVSWAHIYQQFGAAVPPQPSGFKNRLGPHHVSYRAGVLPLEDPGIGDLMSNEAALIELLHEKGRKIYFDGQITLKHAQISDFFQLVQHEFLSGVTYGDARYKNQNWSVWKRAFYVLASPLIPFWRTGRAMADMYRSGRLWQLMPLSPLIMLASTTSGTLGEVVGYTIGSRAWIADKRSEFELDRYAFVNTADKLNAPRTAEQARKMQ
ncbi:MAG: glycosyltransferase [Pseudomonadota bacterium]